MLPLSRRCWKRELCSVSFHQASVQHCTRTPAAKMTSLALNTDFASTLHRAWEAFSHLDSWLPKTKFRIKSSWTICFVWRWLFREHIWSSFQFFSVVLVIMVAGRVHLHQWMMSCQHQISRFRESSKQNKLASISGARSSGSLGASK